MRALWVECVGSPTSTKDKANSQYISEVQTSTYKPILWGWVRLKNPLLTWYQSQVRAYPTELSWTFCSTRYRVANGPPTNLLSHARDEYTSAWGGVLEVPHRLEIRPIHNI